MGPPPGIYAELAKWRDKAIKRGKATDFASDIIPDWLHQELFEAQKVYGPVATFSFLKQVPLSVRMKAEKEIKRKIQKILSKYESQAARAVRRGEEFDYAGMADELRAAVMPEVSNLVLDSALRLSVDTGISFDPSVLNTEALRWAREYSFDLVQGLTQTTRNQISEATAAFIQTPGMTIGDITNLIQPAFGPVRSQMIAASETTRAYSMATNRTQALLQAETPELTATRVWNTMQDELVCPICGPLEGAPESEFGKQFPDGPPAHPNCRCSSSIRFDAPEQLEAEFGTRQAEREAWMRERGLWKEPESSVVTYDSPRDEVSSLLRLARPDLTDVQVDMYLDAMEMSEDNFKKYAEKLDFPGDINDLASRFFEDQTKRDRAFWRAKWDDQIARALPADLFNESAFQAREARLDSPVDNVINALENVGVHIQGDADVSENALNRLYHLMDENEIIARSVRDHVQTISFDLRPYSGHTAVASYDAGTIHVYDPHYMSGHTWTHEIGHGAEAYAGNLDEQGFGQGHITSTYGDVKPDEDWAELFAAVFDGGFEHSTIREWMPTKYQYILERVPGLAEWANR